MLIKAEQKNIRIGPRKMRLVVEQVKKLKPREAIERLKFLNKRVAEPLEKTIKQVLANAVNVKKLKEETLKFKQIEVLGGASIKRWQAVSRGRAHPILKRTCHLKIILEANNGSKS